MDLELQPESAETGQLEVEDQAAGVEQRIRSFREELLGGAEGQRLVSCLPDDPGKAAEDRRVVINHDDCRRGGLAQHRRISHSNCRKPQ